MVVESGVEGLRVDYTDLSYDDSTAKETFFCNSEAGYRFQRASARTSVALGGKMPYGGENRAVSGKGVCVYGFGGVGVIWGRSVYFCVSALLPVCGFGAIFTDNSIGYDERFETLKNGDLKVLDVEAPFEWVSALYTDLANVPVGEKVGGLLVGIAKRAKPNGGTPWLNWSGGASGENKVAAVPEVNSSNRIGGMVSGSEAQGMNRSVSSGTTGGSGAAVAGGTTYENIIENPEPASFGLVGLALAGTVLGRRYLTRRMRPEF